MEMAFWGEVFPGKKNMGFKPFGFLRWDLPQAVKFEANVPVSVPSHQLKFLVQGGLLPAISRGL